MYAIRLNEKKAEESWRALLRIGTIHRLRSTEGRVYLVSQEHIRALEKLDLPFEKLDNRTAGELIEAAWK